MYTHLLLISCYMKVIPSPKPIVPSFSAVLERLFMKIFCLGGAGKICGEAVRDLVEYSNVERITIGDPNTEAAHLLIDELDDDRIDYANIDITNKKRAVALLEGYDIVMDGTTITIVIVIVVLLCVFARRRRSE